MCCVGHNKTFDTHIAMTWTNYDIPPYPPFWVFWANMGVWGYDILGWYHSNMGIKSFVMTQITQSEQQTPLKS